MGAEFSCNDGDRDRAVKQKSAQQMGRLKALAIVAVAFVTLGATAPQPPEKTNVLEFTKDVRGTALTSTAANKQFREPTRLTFTPTTTGPQSLEPV